VNVQLLSARKEPGKYVEGVVLSDNLEALFLSVPPPLSLALAMTEKHEKAGACGDHAEARLHRTRGRLSGGKADCRTARRVMCNGPIR